MTAVVVRAPGRADITEESLLQTLKRKIAGYKVPKRVFFVTELPRNTMGKVQKNVLRDHYRAQAGENRRLSPEHADGSQEWHSK